MPECEQPVIKIISLSNFIARALSSSTKSGASVSAINPTGSFASKSVTLGIFPKKQIF